MAYTIIFNPAVRRQVRSLPGWVNERLRQRIEALAADPHGPGTKALSAEFRGMHRLRVGDYRVIYHVDEPAKTLTIMRIGHRSHVYDDLARMQLDAPE
jgi:mRNA interferase RelE/StbE